MAMYWPGSLEQANPIIDGPLGSTHKLLKPMFPGRTGVPRFLFGSGSHSPTHRVTGSVLVVRRLMVECCFGLHRF